MCLFYLLASPSWGFPGFTRVRLDTFVSGSFRLGFSQLAPYIFTELFRPLVTYWTQQGIHIVVYPYDGVGEAPSYQVTLDHSTKVKSDLVHSGFVPNLKNLFGSLPWLSIGWVLPSISSRVCFSSQGRKSSKTLSGCAVQWFTDKRYIPSIILSGSMKRDLHQLALSTF